MPTYQWVLSILVSFLLVSLLLASRLLVRKDRRMDTERAPFDPNLRTLSNKPLVTAPGGARLLGCGISACVYGLETSRGGVAVKVSPLGDGGIDRSMLREASILSRLNHPNVMEVLDVLFSDTSMALMLPRATGTLEDYKNRGWYPESGSTRLAEGPRRTTWIEDVKYVTLQIARAMRYLHDNNVLHGDYKLANIMVYESRDCPLHIVVGDFGMASMGTCYGRTKREAFTVWYRPPEILLGGNYTYNSDAWSLGCIVGELLTGRPLFEASRSTIKDRERERTEMLYLQFRRLGFPDSRSWPTVATLPGWNDSQLERVRNLYGSREVSKGDDSVGRYTYPDASGIKTVLEKPETDFLNRLLVLDPTKRESIEDIVDRDEWLASVRDRKSACSCRDTWRVSSRKRSGPMGRACRDQLVDGIPAVVVGDGIRGDIRVRTLMTEWVVWVSMGFDLLDRSVGLALSLIDRFLKERDIDRDECHLYAYAAVHMASNMVETEWVALDDLLRYVNSTGEERRMREVEQEIVRVVGVNLQSTTLIDLVEEYTRGSAELRNVSREVVLLSYYTQVGREDSRDLELVAMTCVELASQVSGVPNPIRETMDERFGTRKVVETMGEYVYGLKKALMSVEADMRKNILYRREGNPDPRSVIRGLPNGEVIPEWCLE